MTRKLTPIASAVALLLMGASSMSAQAQQATATTDQPVDKVIVTGIRAALQQSLNQKRAADTDIEVVTSEDVGKMPDKNVADALQRIPGVNTASQASGEGGFDENDRVSIRGTSASLTQVTINGHAVSSGDWFLLDQFQTVGRSVSFTLLPSELVSSVVVHKAPEADLTEGGVAGDVDIKPFTPLQFRQQLTAEATIGAVYSTLPRSTDPQFNAMINWKNDDKTFGVLLQAFDEKRTIERYGQEDLAYAPIPATDSRPGPGGTTITINNPIAVAHPDLVGILAPTFIGAALFNQTRVREGGDFAFDFKPSNDFSFDLNGFYSKMQANNSNTNWLANINSGYPYNHGFVTDGLPLTSYTTANGALTSASWAVINPRGAWVDSIFRQAYSSSDYLDLDAKYRVNDRLTIAGQVGTTKGVGATTSSMSWEAFMPTALSYSVNGSTSPTTVSFPSSNFAYSAAATNWLWNENPTSTDKENYGQLDGTLSMDAGIVDSLKFGLRYGQHTHGVVFPVDGACCLAGGYSSEPVYSGATYPSNFASTLGGGFGGGWMLNYASVANFFNTYGKGGTAYTAAGGASREYWPGEMQLTEDDSAAYVMANLVGKDWSGNVGLRLTHTAQDVLDYEPYTPVTGVAIPGNVSTTSAFGDYALTPIDHTYNNILPSLNLKFDLSKNLVARFSVANTMARPDYEALGGSVVLTDSLLAGSGGNPDLKPIRSTNWDSTLEWYFAPKSLLQASLFYMDFQQYVDYGVSAQSWYDQQAKAYAVYQITSPYNTAATNEGAELAYQQGFSNGFGVLANFTLADGHTSDGSAMVGNSKDTYNLTGYWEGHGLSARVAYTYRSEQLVGLDRSSDEREAGIGNVALALNYTINKNLAVSFDALNLNNAPLIYYANNTSEPRAYYINGSQYYLTLHAKM